MTQSFKAPVLRVVVAASATLTGPRRFRYLISALAVLLTVCVIATTSTSSASGSSPGAISAVYEPITHPTKAELSDIKLDLMHRLNALGTGKPTVVIHGDLIEVSDPRVNDPELVLGRELVSADEVYFRPVLCYAAPYSKPSLTAALPQNCTPSHSLTTANLAGSVGGGTGVYYTPSKTTTPTLTAYPSTTPTSDKPQATVLLPGLKGTSPRYLLGPAELTYKGVKTAVAKQATSGRWVVNVTLTSSGSTGWNAMAKENFHKVIGIDLDGVVQSAPITLPNTVAFKTFTGEVQISGDFTEDDVVSLAQALDWGPLPIPLKKVSACQGSAKTPCTKA